MKKVAQGPLPGPKEIPIVATEVAKISRNDTLKRTSDKFKEMVLGSESKNGNWRLRPKDINNYFIASLIAFAVVGGLFLLTRGNSKFKEAAASINEKLRISESRLLLKQNYEARKFLSEAFAELNALEENGEKEKLRLAAAAILNQIEKVETSVKPAALIDLTKYQGIDLNGLKNVLVSGGKIFINDSVKIYALKDAEAMPVAHEDNIVLSWLKENKIAALGNTVKIIDLEKGKISETRRKFNFEPLEMKNYEDNLYFLGPKNIYKITNALASPREELDWLKSGEAEKIPGNFTAFDLDSNIYVLTDQRKLAVMFKGKAEKIIDLDFDIRPTSELFKTGDNELLAVDKETKLARLISDEGELRVSYDLSAIDTVKDAFLDKPSRTRYILSPAHVWELKL